MQQGDGVSGVTFLMVILTVSHPSPFWYCCLVPFTESICIVGHTPWCRIPADMRQLNANCLMSENTPRAVAGVVECCAPPTVVHSM